MRTQVPILWSIGDQPLGKMETPNHLYHFANYALCLLVVCTGGLWKAAGSVDIIYRNVLKVLWCSSHLVWLVLRIPSLHALVFIQKLFRDLFLLFSFVF